MRIDDKNTIRLAYAALYCALYFAAVIPAIHILKPELSLLSDTLSLYALGKYGLILTLGFYAIALNQFLIAMILILGSTQVKQYPAAYMFILAGFGTVVVAYFPILPLASELMQKLPHIAGASMQLFMFPMALLMLRPGPDVEFNILITRVTAYITLTLFIMLLLFFIMPPANALSFFGLLEKIDIILITGWLIYMPYSYIHAYRQI